MSVKTYRRVHEIELENIVVEDGASLERLMLHKVNYGPSVRITRPTKLKMLGYLGAGIPIIQLGYSTFKVRIRSMYIFAPSTFLFSGVIFLNCTVCW